MMTLALCIVALLFPGCRKDSGAVNLGPSSLLFVNTSLHTPEVDIFANGSLLYSDLSFPDSTGYIPTTAGVKHLALLMPGNTDTLAGNSSSFLSGRQYSVFLVDAATNAVQITAIPDSLPVVPAGYVELRFLNFSYSSSSLDLYSSSNLQYLFTDRYFNESDAAATSFVAFPEGTYSFEIRQPGSIQALATLTGMALQGGNSYTLFSMGTLGGVGNHALSIELVSHN
jgi:hypothetical protein